MGLPMWDHRWGAGFKCLHIPPRLRAGSSRGLRRAPPVLLLGWPSEGQGSLASQGSSGLLPCQSRPQRGFHSRVSNSPSSPRFSFSPFPVHRTLWYLYVRPPATTSAFFSRVWGGTGKRRLGSTAENTAAFPLPLDGCPPPAWRIQNGPHG